jgi:hypothetical protein
MASSGRVKALLDSLDEKVEGLREAVDKLSAAAKRVSDDQGEEGNTSAAETKEAAHS